VGRAARQNLSETADHTESPGTGALPISPRVLMGNVGHLSDVVEAFHLDRYAAALVGLTMAIRSPRWRTQPSSHIQYCEPSMPWRAPSSPGANSAAAHPARIINPL
jgi:hypothetical protein